jgi:3-methyladenine DNA glycosylase Mpg
MAAASCRASDLGGDWVSELVHRSLRPCSADADSFPECLASLCESLLRGAVLVAGDERHRLVEVEAYLCTQDERHRDLFTHCDELQRTAGQWYFHRSGSSFRGGTYKGLDLTIGHPRGEWLGGVLIRSIAPLSSSSVSTDLEDENGSAGASAEPVDTERSVIEGPCNCVDHLLRCCGAPDIITLVRSPVFRPSAGAPSGVLRLERRLSADGSPRSTWERKEAEAAEERIVRGPRVGLSLKRLSSRPELVSFVARPYRFMRRPESLRKAKHALFLFQLHEARRRRAELRSSDAGSLAQGQEDEILRVARFCSVTAASARKWSAVYDAFDAERWREESFGGRALSVEEECRMLVTCLRRDGHARAAPASRDTL